MTFHELIIQSIDSEITQYELEKEQCLKPIYSDKHRRIIKKAKGIAERNLNGSSKRMRRIHKRYILVAALISILLMAMIISSIAERKPGYSMNIEKRKHEWNITFEKAPGTITKPFTYQRGDTPTGYRAKELYSDEETYIFDYTNEKNPEIGFNYDQSKISESTSFGLDCENDYMRFEKLDGVKTIVSKKGNGYSLFWIQGNNMFFMCGNCDLKTLKEYKSSIHPIQ